MRCLVCYYLIALPDIINGEPGKAGAIRRKQAKPMEPQVVTVEFTCTRCGSRYVQSTQLLPVKAVPAVVAARTESELEAEQLWLTKGKDRRR